MLVKGDKKTIRAWAMYDWANSAYALTITSAVFPIFYELMTSQKNNSGEVVFDRVLDTYGIVNTSLYSYSIAAGFLLIAILAPILSGIADYSDSKKTFLKFFCYLGSAACAGLYFFSFANIWFGMLCVMFACVGFSGSLIFYNAYLPEIAEAKDHDRISALGFSLGYIGSVLLLIFNLAMIMFPEWFFDLPSKTAELISQGFAEVEAHEKALGALKIKACKISCLSVGIWWAGWAQITFAKLPNKVFGDKISNHIIMNGYREIKKVWFEIGQTKRLKRFLTSFFFYNTGVQTVMYMAANFAAKEIRSKDAMGNDIAFATENLIISILIIQLVGVIGAFLFSFLSKKFGNLKALIIAVSFWIILVAGAFNVVYEKPFYILAAGVGLVMGGVQALSRSTYSKFLPETKDHASYFSFYNMCYYVGTVLGMVFFGLILTWTENIRICVLSIAFFFITGCIGLFLVPKNEVQLNELE